MSTELITLASLVGNLPTAYRPDRALWTKEEVLNWIGFGIAAPNDLTGYNAIIEKWGSEPSLDGASHEMHSAFVALAEGRPLWDPRTASPIYPGAPEWLLPQKPPLLEVREERALAAIQSRKRSARDLADELAEELSGYAERRAQYLAAEHDLVEAEQRGDIEWRRAPAAGAYAGREPWLHWYLGEDVLKLWPRKGTTEKPSIPQSRLATEWAQFVAGHIAACTRPTAAACRQAMAEAFPDHTPPRVRQITKLRGSPPTPTSWTETGRHKGKN